MQTMESQQQYKAETAIRSCPVYAIRKTQVAELSDGLVLTGRVDSYYQKQMAQEIVAAVCRDIQVINELQVSEMPAMH